MQQVNTYISVLESPPRLRRIRTGGYRLTLVDPLRPVRGLGCSVLMHAALILSLPYLARLLPEPPIRLQTADLSEARYESLELPALPASSGGGGPQEKIGKNGLTAERTIDASAASESKAAALPETIYAGPQEIVSNFRRATNTVQTIRRPDVVHVPKLKFPLRIQSLVMLAIPVAQPRLAAPVPQPASSADKLSAKMDPVDKPVITVRRYEPHRRKAVDSGPPQVTAIASGAAPALVPSKAPVPLLSPEVKIAATQTAVVINAVTLPPQIPKVVPNAEVTGSFAVLRMHTNIAPDPAPTDATGNPSSDPSVTASWEPGTLHVPKSGKGDGAGAGTSGNGSGSGLGESGSGPDRGGDRVGRTNRSGGNGFGGDGIPGISIAGSGLPSPSLPSRETVVHQGPNYDLMIVASGANGGASRDLGIFDHSHAVYTVYITMSDSGGGPDWSMQYALAGQTEEGEGLLVPPMPWKKVPVLEPNAREHRETQFVAAIIDANGEPKDVRAVGNSSSNSELAVETLKQWRFTPAELNGKPQAIQVLVGVVVSRKTAVP